MARSFHHFRLPLVLALLTVCLGANAQDTVGQRIKQLFDKADKDGNGTIERGEIRLKAAFDQADADGDGKVTLEEFAKSLPQRRGTPGTPATTDEPAPAANADSPFRAAADYLRAKNGHAMLVYYQDKLVFEEYFNGWSADQPHRLASGTKSFSGAMLAAAAQDGLLDIDERVAKTITEWQDQPRKQDITLRHLLSLTSGIEPGGIGDILDYSQAILEPAIDDPGNKFRYGPTAYMIFGEVMKRKLADRGESPLDYLKRRIFGPIGLEFAEWRHTPEGNPHLPSGALITAREWAKFGLLIQHKGNWQGRQIIDKDLLEECFKPAPANPSYGLTFWLGRGVDGPDDLVMAAGAGKQKLYIVPSMDLLIVQFAEARGYQEKEFLTLALPAAASLAKPAPRDDAYLGAPGSHVHHLVHDGRDRVFRLHVPASYDGTTATPAVFVLHGGGGSSEQAEESMGFDPLSDAHGFIAVYPEGINHHWNDGRESPRFPQANEADDVGYIRELVGVLEAGLKLDTSRLYVTGHSNGGFMSNRLGWELSEVWAAIAPSSGTLAADLKDQFAPKQPLPVMHIHGSADKLVPIDGGMVIGKGGLCLSAADMVALWAKADGCPDTPEVTELPKKTNDPTSVRRTYYAPGPAGAEVVYFRIEKHGHGFAGQTPTRLLTGLATQEFDAPTAIWEFFSRHVKPVAPKPE